MTDTKNLIDAAFARSTFNDRNLATTAELIGVIDRRLKQLYSMVARVNPYYFGKVQPAVAYDAAVTGWKRPEDAEMLISLFNSANGNEVHVVPFYDRVAEMPPRVYEFGQVYRSVGTADDPATTWTLDFYYSKRHPDLNPMQPPTATVNQLDGSWPEQFNDLVVLHLTRYLAVKDSRGDEGTLLAAEEAALMEVFMDHLAHENYGVKARWEQRPISRSRSKQG